MEKVCIVCPRGCHLKYEYQEGQLKISNNRCMRGPEYLKQELILPKRMLTTTIQINGETNVMLPVYSEEYVAKDDVINIIKHLKQIKVNRPVYCGDVITEEIDGKHVVIRASKDII